MLQHPRTWMTKPVDRSSLPVSIGVPAAVHHVLTRTRDDGRAAALRFRVFTSSSMSVKPPGRA